MHHSEEFSVSFFQERRIHMNDNNFLGMIAITKRFEDKKNRIKMKNKRRSWSKMGKNTYDTLKMLYLDKSIWK